MPFPHSLKGVSSCVGFQREIYERRVGQRLQSHTHRTTRRSPGASRKRSAPIGRPRNSPSSCSYPRKPDSTETVFPAEEDTYVQKSAAGNDHGCKQRPNRRGLDDYILGCCMCVRLAINRYLVRYRPGGNCLFFRRHVCLVVYVIHGCQKLPCDPRTPSY